MPDLAGRPLAGKTVVVTRPREQAASLAEPLAALGAHVLLVPTIRVVPRAVDDQIVRVVVSDLDDYRLIVFTSANAVRVFLGYFTELGASRSALADTAIAAVGPATASALEQEGIHCDVVAEDAIQEGLLASLARSETPLGGALVLIPRAREARNVLPDALRAAGARVNVLPIYETVSVEALGAPSEQIEAADFITFTSGSTVRRFAALMNASGAGRPLGARLSGARLCSIGPVTSEALHQCGLLVSVEAVEHTSSGLVAAIVAAAGALA